MTTPVVPPGNPGNPGQPGAPGAPSGKKKRRRRGRKNRGGGQNPQAQGQPGQAGAAEGAPAGPVPPQQPRPQHHNNNNQGGHKALGALTGMLANGVAADVRRRGETYFHQGRIFTPEASPEHLSAEVRGKGGNYRVSVDMSKDDQHKRATVNAVCACPYFTGGAGYCKHIWAVLCYADGNPECTFKPPQGHQVGMRSIKSVRQPRPDRRPMPQIVSANPDATGRIRGYAPGAIAPPIIADIKHAKRQNRPEKNLISWRDALKLVGHAQREIADARHQAQGFSAADAHYALDFEATARTGQLTVQVLRLAPTAEGSSLRQLVAAPVDPRVLDGGIRGPDREILTRFFGAAATSIVRAGQWNEEAVVARARANSFTVADGLRPQTLEQMAATGRLGWLDVNTDKQEANGPFDREAFKPLGWDASPSYSLHLSVGVTRQGQAWSVKGELRRGSTVLQIGEALATFADGFVVMRDRVARFDLLDPRVYGWVRALRQAGAFEVPKPDQAAFLRNFASLQSAPALDLPESTGWKVVAGEPKPRLLFMATPVSENLPVLTANYEFAYETPVLPPGEAEALHDKQEADDAIGNRAEPAAAEPAEIEGNKADDAAAEGDDKPARQPARSRRRGAPAEAPPPVAAAAPAKARVVVLRSREREEHLIKELCEHPGVQASAGRAAAGADVFVDATNLSELVGSLTDKGWSVEAEGHKLRVGRSFAVDVVTSSGMDWLDLRALFDFGDGVSIDIPKILATVAAGGDRVVLGDGSVGILPQAWLQKLAPVLRMGEGDGKGNTLRFNGSQAAFLDVLVSEAAEATLDKNFTAFRKKLADFSGVTQAEPAKAFVGELRPYQRQGLGWLEFLDEFAFGGCLADDMGLGKTVQVLAHLQKRRGPKKKVKGARGTPSLIVAPTSLIHNWVDEARRFTPDLEVYAHLGASRHRDIDELLNYDLVVTSYGTMRSDIENFATLGFDYVVLDEAQAIKNEGTQVAQAARLLKAHRRLAMSGTPVENRLAELGSLFRFLNPGMLESATGFAELFSNAGKLGPQQLEALARFLRPFLLRRTKEQVLPDLPGKTESTVYAVLDDDRRREYDELAAFYRDSLKKKIKVGGLGKARMHVLEALLRLRQMACHPGLIDEKRIGESSAKLELLEEQLDEVMASGRKALVFSQFTSMLAIVRQRLDDKGIVYEYLDGSCSPTARKASVENFQTNKDVRVFLISLKAGGVGLNLTAADYCFILDPWWNPASEAQAIDRAHRIGQKNHVFAYRLIARGTVEEKILSLQAGKRQLVEGIIANDGDVMADITAKDLDFLLE